MEFLKIVSHTNDSITNELQQQYTENGNEVYDGNDLDFDINDRGQNTCIKCDLRIYEKHMLYPCNDTNVCLVCITDIQETFSQPQCPNQDCGQVFTKVLKEKKRKKQNDIVVIVTEYLPKNVGNILKWCKIKDPKNVKVRLLHVLYQIVNIRDLTFINTISNSNKLQDDL